MKLVELLAKEMGTWPEDATHLTQSILDTEVCNSIGDVCSGLAPRLDLSKRHTEDKSYPEVTRAQWQAERDRQKGGEWKRHRGGKCPVPAGTKVSTRHRSGEVVGVHFHTATTGSGTATMNSIWKHTGDDHDIMAYKVISQPQAEEVEVIVGKDVKLEYAFSEEGVSMEDLDWKPIGGKLTSVEGVDPALFGEVEDVQLRDTLSTYKEFTVTGQWHKIDGPIKWRDTINELDACIEEFTREREALINRLAIEGFALIPAMAAVMGVADIDMSDWRNWKAGDVVTVHGNQGGYNRWNEIDGSTAIIDSVEDNKVYADGLCFLPDELDRGELRFSHRP